MASVVSVKEIKPALCSAFRKERPNTSLDKNGYTETIEGNLIEGVQMKDFEEDLRQGDGNELECKFRAVHSSSALVVNCFAPFKRHLADLNLLGQNDFDCLQLEKKCRTGLRGRPNLDVVVKNRQGFIGIESKFTEYIKVSNKAHRLEKYLNTPNKKEWCGKWLNEMEEIHSGQSNYKYLHATQLIKHAFGISNTFCGNSVLLYLYWEPANASQYENFKNHRDEIEKLKSKVSDATPSFTAMSYSELWRAWSNASPSVWLTDHLKRLRSRYEIEV